MTVPRQTGSVRDGFTLIEVVVAMVLLAAVLVMLAGMTFVTAQRSNELRTQGTRQSLMLQAVNWLTAVPYDSLPNQIGCRSTQAPDGEAYTVCIDLLTTGQSNARDVRIRLDAARDGVPTDTLTFRRSRAAECNPLTGPC